MTRLRVAFNARRHASGMSYDDLAGASGISRRTLINIGTGSTRGDIKTWLILARTFGVTLDDLLAPVWE